MTSVECYTVIESSAENIDRAGKDEVIRIISNGISAAGKDLGALAGDLILLMK